MIDFQKVCEVFRRKKNPRFYKKVQKLKPINTVMVSCNFVKLSKTVRPVEKKIGVYTVFKAKKRMCVKCLY